MKRTVFCVSSFLLLLLVFLTLLSPKVEEEMKTVVFARTGEAKDGRSFSIQKAALDWKNSKDRLFVLKEGEGWDSGLRISEIPSKYFDEYSAHPGSVTIGSGTSYWYVYSASREPVTGDAAVVAQPERKKDTCLLWCPDPITDLSGMTKAMTVKARTDNAVLFDLSTNTFPYFEHDLWYRFKQSLSEEVRIYSMHDVQQFLQALPWIAGAAAILSCGTILLAAGWSLTGRKRRGRSVWIINLLLIAAMLSVLPWLLGQFDLPASLMPDRHILDFSHYLGEMKRIIGSMDAMGEFCVRDWLSQAAAACAVVAGASLSLTCFIVFLENKLRIRNRPHTEEESVNINK